jgi:hypothetical protein
MKSKIQLDGAKIKIDFKSLSKTTNKIKKQNQAPIKRDQND